MFQQEFLWTIPPDYDEDTIKSDFYINTNTDFTAAAALLYTDLVSESVTYDGDTLDTYNFVVTIDTGDTIADEAAGAGSTSTGLKPDTKYFWMVVAKDFSSGTELSTTGSVVWEFTTDPGYLGNSFAIDEDFLAYNSDGSIETTVSDLLSDSIYDWGTSTLTIDDTLGNPYPSLKIGGADHISTIPVNHFSDATLQFDFKVGGTDDEFVLTMKDSNNAGATLVDLSVEYDGSDTAEKTQITVPSAAASLGGKYWTLNAPVGSYYVWYDIDNGSTDPTPGGLTAIEVDVSLGDPADTVATNTAATIDAQGSFSATATLSDVIVTNAAGGDTTDAADVDSAVTIAIIIDGADATFKTYLYAQDYQSPVYTKTSVVEIPRNVWSTLQIVLDLSLYSYEIFLNTVSQGTITTGAVIASPASEEEFLRTLTQVDNFRIAGLTGVSTVWIDNVLFSITEVGWIRSVY